MYRFFVEESQIYDGTVHITGSDVNHIKNVLRMRPGEKILVSTGGEKEYHCAVSDFPEGEVLAAVEEVTEADRELPSGIVLFQGLPKGDKMELIIQKAVELGATEIVPVEMKRCVVKLDRKKAEKKAERWQTIALGAAKQSKRMQIPTVHMPVTFQQALAMMAESDVRLMPYENAEGMEGTRRKAHSAHRNGRNDRTFHSGVSFRRKGTNKIMEAYLDNSATTCVYQETADLVCDLMVNHYGNPSAMHQKGVEAEQYIRTAQETLAKILKVKEKEIFFTSGGTESDNWALVGTAMANKRTGNHIITSAIEHPAVSAPLAFLEEQGFRITRLPVNKEGLVDVNELEEAITPETILVSIMYVNNEIGAVEPIGEIGRRIKAKNPKTYFHVDAIQAFGKYRIYPKRMGIDMLSVSGHKIHGPKGSGFLYIDEKVKIRPLILGGGQQNGMRSGTDNVPGIAGLAKSAEIVYKHFDEQTAQMRACKHRLIEGLRELDDVVIHGMPEEEGAPQIVNASFLNVRSEVLLHTLEDRQIYVSAGSACSSHKRAGSPTLTAIGASKAEMESAVRFSFSEFTTLEQIDYTLDTLREVLPMLRRFTRK